MTLYPYQERGAFWLAEDIPSVNRPGKFEAKYLADPPRMGKSVQSIIASTQLLGLDRIGIACKAEGVPMWRDAWATWAPGVKLPIIRSYDQLVRGERWEQEMLHANLELVIADEAHALKSLEAKRTHVLLGSRQHPGLATVAQRAWALSATPQPNHPGELFPVLAALRPDLLRSRGIRSYEDFLDAFTVYSTYQRTRWSKPEYIVRDSKNEGELNQLLYGSGFMLRRDPDIEGVTMPKIVWSEIAHLGPCDRLIEEDDTEEGFAKLRRKTGMAKAKPAAELIASELEEGAIPKVLVVAYHRDVLAVLLDRLAPFGAQYIDGDTRPAVREEVIRTFQTNPACRVMVAQIQTVMTSISLSAADHVELVERQWSPDDNLQVAMRLGLIGKTHPIWARVHTLRGSQDSDQARALLRKEQMTKAVIG